MSQSNTDVDIELSQPAIKPALAAPHLLGYPSFAQFIAEDADAAVYRKYEHLSARNLLYLQSELHELETQLEDLDAADVKERESNDHESQKLARLWHHYARDDNDRAIRHRSLQAKIRLKVREYRKFGDITPQGYKEMTNL
ncbi:MAG: hypothetical protein Q9166_006901 [cf. Caloplaca sp. 2 TL-2023]